MKKLFSLILAAGLILSLAACGAVVDYDTPKSEELSAAYDFYRDSQASLASGMAITPEQADEVFIVLVSCGMDGKVSNVTRKQGDDGHCTVNTVTSFTAYDVYYTDGVVDRVEKGGKELYPEMYNISHLTKTDRYKLEAALLAKEKPQAIADRLHVHVSTIYREIKRARMIHRNSDWTEEERYNPDEAHRKYRRNLEKKGAGLKIGNDLQLADYLEKKVIDDGYSPAAALASIEIEGKKFSTSICVSTFYSYITKGVFRFLTNADLPEKPKKKRTYKKVKTMKRPPRGDSIEKRPAEVDTRETFGHWEGDTVYSKKDGSKALFVLTERLTREEIIVRIKDRTAESVIKALDRIERKYGPVLFRKIFQTITVDNGGEFADVDRLERSALRKTLNRTKVYFCHPYSSYERGSNECQNKMIRRPFPKGTDFGNVTDAEVAQAERWMNNYPRKILGWKTSEMLFRECVAALI